MFILYTFFLFPFYYNSYNIARGDIVINWNFLKDLIIVASISSIICVAFIQKIKHIFKSSTHIPYFSMVFDLILAVLFCISFTEITFPSSLWVGFFSYIGADTLYKALEGKLKSYSELTGVTKEENLEEIKYE